MYFRHARLYKSCKILKSKRKSRVLPRLNASAKCNALILIKMARLRFPGRPGQRIGKNYVKYVFDDVKITLDPSIQCHYKIKMGLKLFYELFGCSDEEEEFEGFTSDDVIQARNYQALKLKEKQTLHRYIETNPELSLSSSSDSEKILTSSDSEASSSSLRQQRGMRDIARKSYDKMIKEGLCKNIKHNLSHSKSSSVNIKHILKNENDLHQKTKSNDLLNLNGKSNDIDNNKINLMNSQIKLTSKNSIPKTKSFVKHLIDRAKHNRIKRQYHKRTIQSNVRKKFKKKIRYSQNKYSHLPKKSRLVNSKQKYQRKLHISKNIRDRRIQKMHPFKMQNIKSAKSKTKQKKFILPAVSARSCRKIIPRKRYFDELETSLLIDKKIDEDSQLSKSSRSASSETISAMDGGSSPDNTEFESENFSGHSKRKVGLLDRPLIIEGKRPWKPSLKVQMKLSEMNYNYPFGLKKSIDGSSGTGTSSGSFKDIIKPDMVSKYAEKMAQKPKEKPLKIIDNKKNIHSGYKSESEKVEDSSDALEDGKKPEANLQKVEAKIDKILKSPWEGRLTDSTLKSTNRLATNFESMIQWENERQQRTSNQRRTKSILRKARLQLKKRNLNLRTRQSEKTARNDGVPLLENKPVNIPALSDKNSSSLLNPCAILDHVTVPSKIIASKNNLVALNEACVVCGFSKVFMNAQKLYEQIACEPCNKFFESFAKEPKQYFCTKDGNCNIDNLKDGAHRRVSSNRCKACWLKTCMEKFTVSAFLRDQLIKYVPRLDAPPHNPLLKEEEIQPSIETRKEEPISKGPRIKHVCRRAAVALGLPRATFSEDKKKPFNLSALPNEEKKKILESDTTSTELKATPEKAQSQAKKKTHKDFKVRNRVHLDLLKKSSLLIHKKQKKRKLLMKKSLKHMHKHSFKKSVRVGHKNEVKNTLKFSYKSAVKTSVKSSAKNIKQCSTKTPKFRKVRCKQCAGCRAEDCGDCIYCLDKKKFGGPNVIKQACMHRRCLRPIMPGSEKKGPKSLIENNAKTKQLGSHSSFGGSASGIIASLTSSSSSPSSPDGSSCGSSCSSSSSSSTGSSGTSSSSTSSDTSNTSSRSESNTLPLNNDVIDNCANVPSIKNEPVVFQEPLSNSDNLTKPTFEESLSNRTEVISQDYNDVSNSVYNNDVYSSEPGFQQLVCNDDILYEESLSITELKNASFTPSLMYGVPMGDYSESVSYNMSSSRNRNTKQNGCGRKQFDKDKDQNSSNRSYGKDSNGDDDDAHSDDEEEEDDDYNGYKKKHHILADYWENYDFERISSQGFALISSQQIPLTSVCFLCCSAGKEKMIYCAFCCEPYHLFCLNKDDIPNEENIDDWYCKRCQCCSICGCKNNLQKCKKCQKSYHPECIAPNYPTKPSRKKKIWLCPKCIKCKSCGASAAGTTQLWNFDLLLCHSCAKLTDKGIEYF